MSDKNIRSRSEENGCKSSNVKKSKSPEDKRNSLAKIIWISLIIIISLLLAQYIIIGVNDMLGISRKEEKQVSIDIPKDSKVSEIADILKKSGVIENKQFFIIYSHITKSYKNFISGSFEIKTTLDYEAIINFIQSNSNRLEKDVLNVTFQEGLTVLECAQLLEQKEVCSKNEFLDLCKSNIFDDNYDFLKNINNPEKRYYKLEGYLFPDTYKFYKNEKAKDVIKRFLNNYEKKITVKKKKDGFESKVSIEDIAKEKNLTPENLITLASMIQAEAANKEDMYSVSSVFCNRLDTLQKDGMSPYGDDGMGLLGSDVTVWYPYRTKSQVPIDIVDTFKSTYNTYKIKGLPPGPVCSPGEDAINAALNPKKTSYYYFCHSKDKKSYYAKTSSEHQKNLVSAGILK